METEMAVNLSRLKLALDNSYNVGHGGIPIPIQDDGTFTLKGVPAAVYRITPAYTLRGYLRAVRVNGADITDSGLDLTHGTPAGNVELLISADAGSIRGMVVDQKGTPQPAR